MVRVLVVFAVLLAACEVGEPPAPQPMPDTLGAVSIEALDTQMEMTSEPVVDGEPDVCGLAAQLSAEDLCSKICDPDALKQAMLDAGVETGRCYLMVCQLPEDVIAQVGVCLL